MTDYIRKHNCTERKVVGHFDIYYGRTTHNKMRFIDGVAYVIFGQDDDKIIYLSDMDAPIIGLSNNCRASFNFSLQYDGYKWSETIYFPSHAYTIQETKEIIKAWEEIVTGCKRYGAEEMN